MQQDDTKISDQKKPLLSRRQFLGFARDESGVAAIEYGLIAAATGLALISSMRGTIFRKPFYRLFVTLGKNLK